MDRKRTRGAGHGQRDGTVGADREPAKRDFDHRGAGWISHTKIGFAESRPVEGTGFRDALVGVTETTEILIERRPIRTNHMQTVCRLRDLPALFGQTGDRDGGALRRVTESNAIAGSKQGRPLAGGVPHTKWRHPKQLPAAWTVRGIDAAKLARDRYRTRGNSHAWTLAARHVKAWIVAGHVGKARGEPREGHGIGRGRMATHDLLYRPTEDISDLVQILAVVGHGNVKSLSPPWTSRRQVEIPNGRHQARPLGEKWIEPDHQCAGGR